MMRLIYSAVRYVACLHLAFVFSQHLSADDPVSTSARSGKLRDLNGYFPFKPVDSVEQWKVRQSEIRRRILVSQGLWPLPTKSPLHAVVHGRVDRDDYVVDRVFFQSGPGHYVTGSLYRPKHATGPMPAIVSPHGHWPEGRFHDAGEEGVRKQIASGAETFSIGGRHPIQARAVQLARMGCLVFVYDMTGYADSIQLAHRPSNWKHLDRRKEWGFMSVQADLRLQNMMGLQTWNSIRAIDFLLELDDADPNRIGVTGASGGGTQSMILAAIDDRIAAAMPCVMVSTAMQGGCSCENAPLLRIDQGNVDIAAATAPGPLGLTAADDWTVELKTKGFPDLVRLYKTLGHPDRLTGVFHTRFKHNYNQVNRAVMYSFFNRHFKLGLKEPIGERDYQPLSHEEATVWTDQHPAPTGDRIGDLHEIALLRKATVGTNRQMKRLIPSSSAEISRYRRIIGGGWETILGRRFDQVGHVKFVQSSQKAIGQMSVREGRIWHVGSGDNFPAIRIEPTQRSIGTVIWVSDFGKESLWKGGQLNQRAQTLVNRGLTIITADLFEQGGLEGKPLGSQRLLSSDGDQGWRAFSGYTYGYNHSLFVSRVHDVLSLIKYAKSTDNREIHLVGMGQTAGPLVAAAGSQAAGIVSNTIVDLQGFSFEDLDRHDHRMFVPGSVKYFDVDGLLSLSSPNRLTVIGGDENWNITRKVYGASGVSERLVFQQGPLDGPSLARRLTKPAND